MVRRVPGALRDERVPSSRRPMRCCFSSTGDLGADVVYKGGHGGHAGDNDAGVDF